MSALFGPDSRSRPFLDSRPSPELLSVFRISRGSAWNALEVLRRNNQDYFQMVKAHRASNPKQSRYLDLLNWPLW